VAVLATQKCSLDQLFLKTKMARQSHYLVVLIMSNPGSLNYSNRLF